MAYRDIIQEPDESLRKVSRPVTKITNRILTLLDDMKETLKLEEGVGLAAPQVGVLRRVVVIDVGKGVIELINPKIIETSEEVQTGEEACLSCGTRRGIVTRPMKVRVRAMDRAGVLQEYEGEGLLARAFCHEVDHLNGRLFLDIMTRELTGEENMKKEAGHEK